MILWLIFFYTRFWSNIPLNLRTRLGNGFVSLPPEVRNDSRKMILLSFSAWGFDFLSKNDISILFCPRFEADFDLLIFLSFFAQGSELILIYWHFYPFSHEVRSWSWFTDTSILFRTRFEVDLDLLMLLSSSAKDFEFLSKNDTSILFRTRFEADLDLLILLSSSAWGSKLIFKRWFAHLTGLTLDC